MIMNKIRDNNGNKLTDAQLQMLVAMLLSRFNQAGFVTDVSIKSPTSIKIGMHMCCFRIDRSRHRLNYDVGQWAQRCKRGYKLTSTPTWEQREAFNHIINDVLDWVHMFANVKSQGFTIRDYNDGRVNNWDNCRFTSWGERFYYKIISHADYEEQQAHAKPKLTLIRGGAA